MLRLLACRCAWAIGKECQALHLWGEGALARLRRGFALQTSQERPYAPGWRACGSLVLAMERGAGPGAAWAFLEPLRLPSVRRECGDGLWLRREGHCTGSHPSLLGTLLAVRAGHAHY